MRMKTLRYGWLLCLFLMAVLPAGAMSDTFRRITMQEGLSDLVVNAIYKDSMGYVWLGTNTSLERYDGVRLKHYALKGKYESQKRVYAVAETEGHVIWAGSSTGLWRLDRNDRLEPVMQELMSGPVRALKSVGADTLLVGTDQGVYCYANGNFRHYLFDKNILSRRNKVTDLERSPDGIVWAATDDGVGRLCLSEEQVRFFPSPVALTSIACLGDAVYVGTVSQGLMKLDADDGQYRPYVDVGCTVISALSTDGRDLLYVATDGNGVHFVSTLQQKVVKSFRHEAASSEGIRSNSVYSILVDSNGLLWAGLYQMGVDYTTYKSRQFGIYRWENRFDSNGLPIRTLTFHGRQKLIGSRDGLFFIDEERQQCRSYGRERLRSSLVVSSGFYEGCYYIGTYGGGMYVLQPDTYEIRDFDTSRPVPFVRGSVFCIVPDADGQLWIGTSQGLFCYKGKELVAHYTSSNSKLPEGNVYEIFFDSTHKGWICTETGMCLWDPSSQSLRTDGFPEGFIHQEKIREVYETSDHQLYFLPEKGPLFVSDLSMRQYKRLAPELMDNKSLLAIIEGQNGWLWIATSNGIYHYDRQEQCIPYHFAHGNISPTFINSSPVRDEQGRLWFGNSRGLVYVDDLQMSEEQSHLFRPVVSQVLVNGTDYPGCRWLSGGLEEVRLDRQYGNLTFLLSGLTYSDVSNLSYEYKMEGRDEEWVSQTGLSEISIYDLPPGTYRLLLRRAGVPESEMFVRVKVGRPLDGGMLAGIIVVVLLVGVCVLVRKVRRTKSVRLAAASERREQEPMAGMPDEPSDETDELQEGADGTETVGTPSADAVSAAEKYKTNKVSPEECKRLLKRLDHEMRQNRPYVNPNLKIADLAEAIGTTAHALSYVFNQYLQRSYYDYVNEFRVEEFKRQVEKKGVDKYTLSALAAECGFNSRATFFRYFKKVTGITPNDYVKQLGK